MRSDTTTTTSTSTSTSNTNQAVTATGASKTARKSRGTSQGDLNYSVSAASKLSRMGVWDILFRIIQSIFYAGTSLKSLRLQKL